MQTVVSVAISSSMNFAGWPRQRSALANHETLQRLSSFEALPTPINPMIMVSSSTQALLLADLQTTIFAAHAKPPNLPGPALCHRATSAGGSRSAQAITRRTLGSLNGVFQVLGSTSRFASRSSIPKPGSCMLRLPKRLNGLRIFDAVAAEKSKPKHSFGVRGRNPHSR